MCKILTDRTRKIGFHIIYTNLFKYKKCNVLIKYSTAKFKGYCPKH